MCAEVSPPTSSVFQNNRAGWSWAMTKTVAPATAAKLASLAQRSSPVPSARAARLAMSVINAPAAVIARRQVPPAPLLVLARSGACI
jgi:hypothetical protein